ncbi:hypothetical protein J3R82DRAFT_6741 [Butyriboletus roseoflavus]|nr:hypothetical protein J3R82DRAFT_6741 [Butyriboletus roseoflavus]
MPSSRTEVCRNAALIKCLTSSKDTLQSYERKPDCFQDAIALVKARCEESRMDEEERIQGTRIHRYWSPWCYLIAHISCHWHDNV